MPETTLQAIEHLLDAKLKNVATTADLQKAVAPLATKKHLEAQTEELARMVADTIAVPFTKRFEHLEEILDFADRVQTLERQMSRLMAASNLN
jgi:hypothetical protein